MKTTQVDGRTIAYEDIGDGPPVLLIHGSSATHKQWLSLGKSLSTRYRFLLPDLIGNGASGSWQEGTGFDPHADVRVIAKLLEMVESPAIIVGNSYSSAMGLEAARLGLAVKSLCVVEPTLFHLLKLSGKDAEWNEIESISTRILVAVDAGEAEKAAQMLMTYWLGHLRWWLTPGKHKRDITATLPVVATELRAVLALAALDYSVIDVPVDVLVGTRTRKPMRAIADILASKLKHGQLTLLQGAGHLSPFTHKALVNKLVVAHLERNA